MKVVSVFGKKIYSIVINFSNFFWHSSFIYFVQLQLHSVLLNLIFHANIKMHLHINIELVTLQLNLTSLIEDVDYEYTISMATHPVALPVHRTFGCHVNPHLDVVGGVAL